MFLIKFREWEKQTGQKWPKYKKDIFNEQGKCIKRKGWNYDAHEMIPNEYGGSLKWHNLHPARAPDQHQKLIHGKDGVLRKIQDAINNGIIE